MLKSSGVVNAEQTKFTLLCLAKQVIGLDTVHSNTLELGVYDTYVSVSNYCTILLHLLLQNSFEILK